MKKFLQPSLKEPKAQTIKFRLGSKQKKFWEEALQELPYEDLSSYIRHAVDRAIAQDLRSKDPKWQALLTAVESKAEKILAGGLTEGLEDPLEPSQNK